MDRRHVLTSLAAAATSFALPAVAQAWPAVTTNDWRRVLKGTPVSPAMTEGSQAALGVAEKTLPNLSTTLTQVVS